MLSEHAHPKSPSLRLRQKARTRASLLTAARRVLARGGFQQATTRAISREAGVATGTFFLHFPDAGALVEALLDEQLGRALARAFQTLPARANLVSRLVHVSLQLFDSYAVEPALSRAAIQGSLFEAAPTGPSAVRLAGFRAWVGEELVAAQRRGEITRVDSTLVFFTFFSVYFALLVAGLRGELTRAQQERLLRASLRRLFRQEGTP